MMLFQKNRSFWVVEVNGNAVSSIRGAADHCFDDAVLPILHQGSASAAMTQDLHSPCPTTHARCGARRPASSGVRLFRDFYGCLARLLDVGKCAPDRFTVVWPRRHDSDRTKRKMREMSDENQQKLLDHLKARSSFPAVFLNGDVEEFAVQATTVAYPPPGSTARIPTLSWEKKYIT